jgi:hypothetical protein
MRLARRPEVLLDADVQALEPDAAARGELSRAVRPTARDPVARR